MSVESCPDQSNQAIYLAALELAGEEERRAFLNAACGEDVERRRRIERLLVVGDPGTACPLDRVLEQLCPTEKTAEPAMTQAANLNASVDFDISSHPVIDRYKLLEQIGEGGMGTVFMAQQNEPIRRRVALKLIKPGMDSREVISRFQAERQALAMMEHPNIARVLDAGTTAERRPYFVMELVRGVPITDYCDHQRLSIDDRLRLFVDICRAIQHAHQKGIIHRDLKPSNVMITLHDGKPVVKVIDFGVAKALNQELTERTLFTQFSQMIGTPLYMSPEQAEMSGLDIDTRSDVYSLGVLLYELLTGTTPFDRETLSRAGFDGMRRIICEQEPPRPSHKVSTLEAQLLSTVSTRRNVDARQLALSMRRELDWIAMKALEKDRNRRYESASAMATEIQRYLNDEAVEACPPSAWYRLRKFTWRNKPMLATGVVVAVALLFGLSATTWQAVRATMAERLAGNRLEQLDQHRLRAETNLDLALEALDRIYLEAIGKQKLLREQDVSSGGQLTSNQSELSDLEKELLRHGLSIYERVARQNQGGPKATFESGKAFYRVALLQTGLEENDQAQDAYAEAITRLKRLTEQYPSEVKYFLELGRAYHGQGKMSRWWPAATDTFSEAKVALSRVIELDPTHTEAYQLRSEAYDAMAQHDQALADQEKLVQLDPSKAEHHYKLAAMLRMVQDARLRDLKKSLKHGEEAVELAPKNAIYHGFVGWIHASLGDTESAVGFYEKAVELAKSNIMKEMLYTEMYINLHEYPKVIEHATKFLDAGGGAWMLQKHGEAYERLGESENALADYDRLTKLNPNNLYACLVTMPTPWQTSTEPPN